MFPALRKILPALGLLVCPAVTAQEMHVHPAPERLGEVSFPISCKPAVQQEFNRAVALLHSFAYAAAREAFRSVAEHDPGCAMAHWGIAMTYFHQLWEPAIAASSVASAQQEIEQAVRIGSGTERESGFIRAAGLIFQDATTIPYSTRGHNYERAMADLASKNKKDAEAQVFYALALLSSAPPTDKTHSRQKEAADLLEPLYRVYPQHPGIPHYLIHAYDNAELGSRGLPAARAYALIAPSAPHALHMPSHIFTRLGLWDDSIASNVAAREAARKAGDIGEELHAMDYLVYAYLQSGRDTDAAQVIEQLKTMPKSSDSDFKAGYAATAMPIRYAVERRQWADAVAIVPPVSAPPHVIAIAIWARGLGQARSGHPAEAVMAVGEMQSIEDQLHAAGNVYWANQVKIMKREVMAWSAQAEGKHDDAVVMMREAADEEDAIEKLPVTPGPIVPAREQLGDLLLEQGHPDLAYEEFERALLSTPGRRGALSGAARSAERTRSTKAPSGSDLSSRRATPARVRRSLCPEEILHGLPHHLASNVGDGLGEWDVLGAHLDAILGIATFLDATVAH
jgi:tetratricopeptide (TPR) repeat protein